MRISDLASRSGVSTTAIRFYEAAGVLPPAPRAANRYREYTNTDLCRLRLVVTLRGLGLDLSESGRLAALCSDGRCDEMRDDLSDQLAQRRRAVATARVELDHLDRELAAAQHALDAGTPLPDLCVGKEEGDARVRLHVRA